MTNPLNSNTCSEISIDIDNDQALTSKVIKMVLINITCYLLAYLVNMIIGRYTSAQEYGKYGLIINSIVSFGSFLMFGFDSGSEYFVTLYTQTKKWPKLHGFFIFMVKLFLYVGGPFFILSILFYVTHMLRGDFSSLNETFVVLEQGHPILLYSWIIPLFAVMTVLASVLYAFNGQLSSEILSGIFFPCIQLVVISFCFFVVGRLHVHYAVYAYGIAIFLAIVLQVFFVKKRVPVNLLQFQQTAEPKTWVAYALPVFLLNMVYFGITTTVLWLLNFFHNQPDYLGYYSSITAISGYFIAGSVFAIVGLFDVYFAPLWAVKDYVKLQKLVNKSFYVLITISLLFFLYIVFFGKKLLGNFGPAYLQAYPGLIIYTAASCLNAATLVWQSLLLYTAHTYSLLKSYVLSYFVLILGVGLASILHMDFSKIMIAYAISQCVFFLCNAFYIWKKLRPIQLFPSTFFKAPV